MPKAGKGPKYVRGKPPSKIVEYYHKLTLFCHVNPSQVRAENLNKCNCIVLVSVAQMLCNLCIFLTVDVLWHENYDLDNIYNPVDADRLNELLTQLNYPKEKRESLYQGFKTGFPLCY